MSLGKNSSNFNTIGVPYPPLEDAMEVTRSPKDNIQIDASIVQSVQEFPPALNTGAFFAQTVRGPILLPYGTKARDQQLRLFYRNEYNTLIQGTVAAITKKFVTTPWEINGDEKVKLTIQGADGRAKTISAIEHFQLVFQNAQFGMGWEFFAQQFLEDFFVQDFGSVVELIGPGEPLGPVDGAITGIAHLDSGRCYITGNPFYPIMYYSLISGSLHRMHASRISRFVDSPSADERFFGIGLCALSRAIAIANRQMLMTRYIEMMVDDKPPPGIITLQGLTTEKRKQLVAQYSAAQSNDDNGAFGKTLWIESVNLDNPIKIDTLNFAQTPEKFKWETYVNLDVDAIALTFGVDRQELWQLGGSSGKGAMGSSGQSAMLAEKAAGKMIGFLYQNFERMVNRRILPREFEFAFKKRDPMQQASDAAIDLQLAQTVQALAAIPGTISPLEIRSFLANSSDRYKDVLSNQAGQVTAEDASEGDDNVSLEDDNPIDVSSQPIQPQASTTPVQGAKPSAQPTPDTAATTPKPPTAKPANKAFSTTAQYFRLKFVNSVSRAVAGQLPRAMLENDLIDALSTAGTNAFTDGLLTGGVTDIPDDEEQSQIQDWLVGQIDYVDGLADQIYSKQLAGDDVVSRADMWVNKSLSSIFDEGRAAADKNASYKWMLGPTEKHCEDCKRLDGQVHRYKEWYSRGWLPKADKLTCGGFNCLCQLTRTDEKSMGRF